MNHNESGILQLPSLLKANREGEERGIFSVCSAHPVVLKAAIIEAKEQNFPVVIEATSNQVNQEGGYTGMAPGDFTLMVKRVAEDVGYPEERIILGGDHLGPTPWSRQPAQEAMAKAQAMVRSYVEAGFRKIHLDTSPLCQDDKRGDNLGLDPYVVAERSALLCSSCEEAWQSLNDGSAPPLYIIGTEVPTPGGSVSDHEPPKVTTPDSFRETCQLTKAAFESLGLEEAWGRVVAVVVQPGVEFGDDSVHYYNPSASADLVEALNDRDSSLVFEAHSTDYQKPVGLSSLIRDHFAILKVGPWLTFAYREALWALSEIEREMSGSGGGALLKETVERVMCENPVYWENYYTGSDSENRLKRFFSFSDRIRYYWPNPAIQKSIGELFASLSKREIPQTLIHQYMPTVYEQAVERGVTPHPEELVLIYIGQVLSLYTAACGLK